MLIHVAQIHHKHGTNFYVAKTYAALEAQIAEYCREWWSDLEGEDDAPENNAEAIVTYFECVDDEYCDTDTAELAD